MSLEETSSFESGKANLRPVSLSLLPQEIQLVGLVIKKISKLIIRERKTCDYTDLQLARGNFDSCFRNKITRRYHCSRQQVSDENLVIIIQPEFNITDKLSICRANIGGEPRGRENG